MKLNLRSLFRTLPAIGMAIVVGNLSATDVPKNLGNGLDKLVQSRIALKKAQTAKAKIATYNGFATEQAATMDSFAIKDPAGKRYLVDIHPNGLLPFDRLAANLQKRFPSLQITAVDKKYKRVGIIEGYVALDDVAALASAKGVTSVQLGLKPYLSKSPERQIAPRPNSFNLIGTAFDQGVTQHRVDLINQIYNPSAFFNWDGTGMQIGLLSNNFDMVAPGTAAANVAAGDLPGPGNPINPTPVFVFEDSADQISDEGRGMCQIAFKMAPKAKLAFATANNGEVGFANNIRGLAGLPGFTKPAQTFAADTICDDVGYFTEPFFAEGPIGNAVDDVFQANVAYFSSAANDIGTYAYDSQIRVVPNGTGNTFAAGNQALKNTNINLAGVPPALYAGGFHNFDDSGNPNNVDVAQLVNVAANNTVAFVLQWDDPYDFDAGTTIGTQVYENTGTITDANPVVTFDQNSTPPLPTFTAGQGYILQEEHTSGNYDAKISVIAPDNTPVIDMQDTGVDEIVRFVAPQTGQYKIVFDRFAGTGNFHFTINEATFTQFVGSDWNVLAFRTDTGAWVPAGTIAADNLQTNQPFEFGVATRTSAAIPSIQYVLARSNIPTGPNVASHLRYVIFANGRAGYGPVEHFKYDSVTTAGHATAAGGNGVAAYSVFRPNIPEYFTSPGPATIYFDKMNNRLPTPEVRLQPRIAAADNASCTWEEVADSSSDPDGNGNFSGTSAAAPHAAAIAALVLQAHGGPHSLSPLQIRSILQRSTFPHDLDPLFASGSASATNGGVVSITVNADRGLRLPGVFDTNPETFSVSYSGPGFLTSLVFNPNGLASQGGDTTAGINGVDANNNYFSQVFPGMIWMPSVLPFTLGSLNGLVAGDITASFSHLAPPPANGTSDTWTMTLAFGASKFAGGESIHFVVGRGNQHSSQVELGPNTTMSDPRTPFSSTSTNSTADLLGGSVLLPDGTGNGNGMQFSGTITDGMSTLPFSGTINNRIGSGYTVQDGYGFINAAAAVVASTAVPGEVTLNSVASRKNHGAAGDFDIPLPGVECRDAGPNQSYTLVYTFANTLSSVGGAFVVDGTAAVGSVTTTGNQAFVTLTGVTNAQNVTVNLIDVHDTAGHVSSTFPITLSVLIGDTGGNGSVNSTDVSQVKTQVGATVGMGNFRTDLNASGSVSSADVTDVKTHSGTGLP